MLTSYYDHQIFMIQANGGVSRYFFELLHRLGAHPAVQPTLFAGFHGSQLPLRTLQGCRVVEVRRFRVGPLWPLATWLCDAANRTLLRGLAPTIYHPTYYRPVKPPRGTKLVVTVYDMIHERFPQLFPGDPTPELKRAACAAADAVICISESTRRDLLAVHPALAGKTAVVHLAASGNFMPSTPESTATTSEPRYALFVGSRRDYKGFDVALNAWTALARQGSDLRLVCAGGGEFSAAEQAEITRRDLGAAVVQRAVSDEELRALYRAAVAFIYPSRYEGFGLPVLEAMACDCPVICSRSSSLPEVGGEAAVYFEPEDVDELARAVERLAREKVFRTGRIAAGREQWQRFSWDQCARQTLEVYRACVGGG